MSTLVRILYLEDSPRDAEIAGDLLERADFPSALEVVADRAAYEAALGRTSYDLILSDHALPGYDGMAALALARERAPDVPFILISGTLGEERAVDCMLQGATDYVLKQRPERLVPAIRRALAEAAERRQRRQAEEALRESEERFRRLVETAPEAIFICSGLQFVYVNAAALGLFGAAAPAQLVGKSVLERVHPDCRSDLRAQIQRLDTTGEATGTVEQVWVGLDGTPVDVIVSAVVFSYQEQRSALVFARDVTGYKRLESQLRQAQKLEAVGQLAGGVAHDFNNILATIMMHLGLLQMNPALDEGTRASLEDLDTEARRAVSLTQQLLMFSRRSVLVVKPLDPNEVTANILKMLRRLIGEHIDLRFDGMIGLPPVLADASMLEQVLMNLVVNARDAMPKGGRIGISTTLVQLNEPEAAANAARRVGRFACLAVSDTGSGMDDATLKRAFEPFFTTKEPGKGTGLGLATVHGIVAQHKGWVEVESVVGQGTTFRIFLPVASEAVVHAAPPEPTGPPRRGHETILVVEDELTLRRTITQTLRLLGYRVCEAANGHEAMKIGLADGADVDLLLTDMVLPEGMTGWELVERLQAARPRLKAIISSGYSEEIVQSGMPARKGLAYLPKPYTARTLAEVVRTCLNQQADREA